MISQTLVTILLVGTAVPSVDGSEGRRKREVFPIELKWVEGHLPMRRWQIEFRFYQYHRGSPPKKIIRLPEVQEIITLEQVQVSPLQLQKR